ncbi:magnesium and cobalt transporter [Desulfobaculum xiamenense]|uniref:Magnesium and cobalt transporter n=1 Tax=Desulfobaculum xiamenense TaxID=995050 RepID=A0A846QEE3_9BACT|nr:hemolysin family protein [Desulfobaculum xiamenense]NJB66738.1 magnesium and cobalt transporter [Desulfobaculum xiamenense]
MEDDSEGLFATLFSKLFGHKDGNLEELILEARQDGEINPTEVAMLLNVLRLGRKQVREIMIPRTDIQCAEVDDPLEEIAQLIIECGHSRIPIYKENRDNIVGIVHAKDLLRLSQSHPQKQPTCRDIMREPLLIPETKNVTDMLQVFRASKIHLAIALDEYGGTSGLVTLEDVMEEIVGEIEDEYDLPRPDEIQVLSDDTIMINGRTPLEEIDDRLGLELTSEQVETLSGYLCELAGRVPMQGETFTVDGKIFEVKDADAKQIHWVLIKPRPKTPSDPEEN